jgi:hypothetical protein
MAPTRLSPRPAPRSPSDTRSRALRYVGACTCGAGVNQPSTPQSIRHVEARPLEKACLRPLQLLDLNSALALRVWVCRRFFVVPCLLRCQGIPESVGSGYYGAPGEYCDQCPKGAICTQEPQNEPEAVWGWWRQDQNTTINNMSNPLCSAHKTRRTVCPVMVPCIPNKACVGGNNVSGGRTVANTLCSCEAYGMRYMYLGKKHVLCENRQPTSL